MSTVPNTRREKAAPVEPFTGEGVDTLSEEWLPTFEWMAAWNNWSEPEKLLQLAGHLARQEWTLLDKLSYDRVTAMLKSKLDPGRKALAVQDFHYLSQGRNEVNGDFIHRLEQTFRRAYGYDKICEETRNTLMHGQLQEGLKYSLMSAPAVSGAQTYPELCLAAKNEERHQLELAKRKQYVPRSTQHSDYYLREKHAQSAANRSGSQSLPATPRKGATFAMAWITWPNIVRLPSLRAVGATHKMVRTQLVHLSQVLGRWKGALQMSQPTMIPYNLMRICYCSCCIWTLKI